MFSNRKIPKLPKLQLNGKVVPNVKKIKLLGVILDSKLTFTPHIMQRIKACKISLMRLKPLMGRVWSPNPNLCRWLYEGVICPMLMYGSVVWAEATRRPHIQKELYKLQRLGLLSIASVRQSTPTRALEIIYNTPPLHLQIQEKAQLAFLRLGEQQTAEWTPVYHDRLRRRGHIAELRGSLPAIEQDDAITPIPNRDKKYAITIQRDISVLGSGIEAYTDGSLMAGRSGAGAWIESDTTPLIAISERLPQCTVFQSELRAICATCEFLLDNPYTLEKTVTLYVDSQSALNALDKNHVTSRLVEITRNLLNEVGSHTTVSLFWIKAHYLINDIPVYPGNFKADALAKAGGASNRLVHHDIQGPRNDMKTHIRAIRDEAWTKEWKKSRGMRQAKLFLQGPQPDIWKDIRKCNQTQISRIVRFLTGHAFLNRHNTVLKYNITGQQADDHAESVCRLCAEAEETPEHLLMACPVTSWARYMTFFTPELDTLPVWCKGVKEFISTAEVRKLEDKEREQTGGI